MKESQDVNLTSSMDVVGTDINILNADITLISNAITVCRAFQNYSVLVS